MSATAARDLVRTVVLKTNPYWPFTRCNRWPYAAAQHLFVRTARTGPDIRRIYLRTSRPRAWIPGLSDIDLTLILHGDMLPDREYDWLASFWKAFTRLKRVFPMLGEVEILDEDEVSTWIAWTSPDPDGPSLTLLHGASGPQAESAHPLHWRRRALNTALVYLTLLPSFLAARDSPLGGYDILRRVRKILRLVEPILVEANQAHLAMPVQSMDAVDLVAGALKALEVAVSHVESQGVRPGVDARPAGHRDTVVTIHKSQTTQTIRVIDDGLAQEIIADRLRSACGGKGGPGGVPLLLSRGLLSRLVRHVEPHEYERLLKSDLVEGGPHPLTDIPPPGRDEFAAHAMDRIFHLPLFVRGAELFLQPLSLRSLSNQLNSVLAAVHFLRDGRTVSYSNARDDRWRGEFQQYVSAFDEIAVRVREQRSDAAHRAAFYLVRSILRDVRDLMTVEMP